MWIDLEGLANLRDVGGMPTSDGGEITAGRLLRSDNLQALTPADIDRLLELGLSDVVDLRSEYEVESEGPGPLADHPQVHIHQHSLFREWREGVGEEKPAQLTDDRPEELPDEALPWVDLAPSVQVDHPVASFYLSYLVDGPDSIVASLRHIGEADGATLVHCAAGKDRTGTVSPWRCRWPAPSARPSWRTTPRAPSGWKPSSSGCWERGRTPTTCVTGRCRPTSPTRRRCRRS